MYSPVVTTGCAPAPRRIAAIGRGRPGTAAPGGRRCGRRRCRPLQIFKNPALSTRTREHKTLISSQPQSSISRPWHGRALITSICSRRRARMAPVTVSVRRGAAGPGLAPACATAASTRAARSASARHSAAAARAEDGGGRVGDALPAMSGRTVHRLGQGSSSPQLSEAARPYRRTR
jgi:hypothetical protein